MIRNILDAVKSNLISGGQYYLIAKALIVTVIVAVIAWVIALALGAVCSYFMCYKKKIISWIAGTVCFLFRGTPVLLLLLLFYYVFFKTSHISTMLIAGAAIGCYGAGHFAEIIAKSVRESEIWQDTDIMRRMKTVFYSVCLPQALEDSLFLVKRLTIHLLQWTTVVGVIAVNDLTEVMQQIGQRTMYPFFALSFAAVLYLIATLMIECIFHWLKKVIKKNREKYTLQKQEES